MQALPSHEAGTTVCLSNVFSHTNTTEHVIYRMALQQQFGTELPHHCLHAHSDPEGPTFNHAERIGPETVRLRIFRPPHTIGGSTHPFGLTQTQTHPHPHPHTPTHTPTHTHPHTPTHTHTRLTRHNVNVNEKNCWKKSLSKPAKIPWKMTLGRPDENPGQKTWRTKCWGKSLSCDGGCV